MAPLQDPRYRQTWNQLSQNAESATETAAAGIWTFQHNYLNPCFSSIANSIELCTGHCLPDREERARRIRERGRSRGRAELSFDFYDDWDQDDDGLSGGLLGGWGNDELDRLLAGSGSHSGPSGGADQAPQRKRGMSYGTRGGRRKSLEPDPTVIPSTSALGFLGRLPFRLGGTLRYKPSAADLQDHPGGPRFGFRDEEGEPLISDDNSDDERLRRKGHTRIRSGTASSGETTNSMRSRGDLFPSDGEDDAVPLSDEFAMVLERRMTITDDRSSGKTKASRDKRPAGSRTISRTMSKTTQSSQSRPSTHRASSNSLPETPDLQSPGMVQTPSLSDLQKEEERVRHEEEMEVEMKRQAAVRLAVERGLHSEERTESISEAKVEPTHVENISTLDFVETSYPSSDGVAQTSVSETASTTRASEDFVPARLPHFR
ncbi:hypothetical protein LZ554_009302 [Drepanopeziza brunnea f. sp. 'monogermtubi']|nr:hypothetical protein LZ554_009302 [Drepanopeziza brunnea f. sp. 'monogermtubi']